MFNKEKLLLELAADPCITNNFHREEAIRAIDRCLAKKLTKENRKFFEDFKKSIAKGQGFSYYLLGQQFQSVKAKKRSGNFSLFKHWRGAKHSPAADCMRTLYSLATGRSLTKQQVNTMVTECKLPDISGEEQTAFYTRHIEQLIDLPSDYPNSAFKRVVIKQYLAKKAAVQKPGLIKQKALADLQRQAQAAYQEKVLAKAIKRLKEMPKETLCFDPQGRVMVEVPPLTEAELDEISTNHYVRASLDVDPNKGTLCSVDITAIPELRDAFIEWVLGLKTLINAQPETEAAIKKLLEERSLSSIIPLQQRMTFRLLLAARVLQTKLKEQTNRDEQAVWTEIVNEVGKSITQEIQKICQHAFFNNTKSGEIDIRSLNIELAAAQKSLAKRCYELLVHICLARFPNRPSLLAAVATLTDKDFETMTATGEDYLRSDAFHQAIDRIVRTEETAHGKAYGENRQAIRIIHTAHYHPDSGKATPYDRAQCMARVPSIAQLSVDKRKNNGFLTRWLNRFKGLLKIWTHNDAVRDAAEKLRNSYRKIQSQLGGYAGPMVYNLFTSLVPKLPDFFDRNHQRASAARIFKASHLVNAEQLQSGNPESLWFIQNIPTNQHTFNLSYHSWDAAIREATLMTDIALLFTLIQNSATFPSPLVNFLQQKYFEIQQEYRNFLISYQQGNLYFNETPGALFVIKQLKQVKSKLALTPVSFDKTEPTLVDLAAQALLKLYANNIHWKKQYGTLVQSLSIFIEQASQGGCKSATDRADPILSRVLELKSLNDQKPLPVNNEVVKALQDFAQGTNADPEVLQKALDVSFARTSKRRLEAISGTDNGGEPKSKTSKNDKGSLKWNEVDTNIIHSGYVGEIDSVSQSGAFQAHKEKPAKVLQKLFAKAQQQPVPMDEIAPPSSPQPILTLEPPPVIYYGQLFVPSAPDGGVKRGEKKETSILLPKSFDPDPDLDNTSQNRLDM